MTGVSAKHFCTHCRWGREKKKMSEVATSAKHSSLSAEAAASMQAVSRWVVTAQMGLLSCPCLSHSVDMLLSAGYTALRKHTLVWRREEASSSPGGTGQASPFSPFPPCSLFERWKSILTKHSKHAPADRLCSPVLSKKQPSFIWKPVHESVMNRFHSEGTIKKRSCFWFR